MLLTKKFANYQKIGKSHKGRNYFCSQDRQHSRHIFKLGVWHVAKTRACLLRFSALKLWLWKSYTSFFQRAIKRSSPHTFQVCIMQPVSSVSHLCSVSFIFRHISSVFFVGLPMFSISAVKDFVSGYKHSMHIALRSYSRHHSLMSKINLSRHAKKGQIKQKDYTSFTTILVIVSSKKWQHRGHSNWGSWMGYKI